MKQGHKVLPISLLGLCLLAGSLMPLAAQGQDADDDYGQPAVSSSTTGRKMLHLFSADFPPNPLSQYPSPPAKETRFWQLLDKEMAATPDLTLTESLEDADYRIELRCGGILNCSKLLVDVKDPNRTVLTSFTLKKVSNLGGLGSPRLEQVAHELAQTLDERIKLLDQGGYGHTD